MDFHHLVGALIVPADGAAGTTDVVHWKAFPGVRDAGYLDYTVARGWGRAKASR